jgi:hypothetical protein
MSKPLLIALLFYSILSAQDITISKDSIQVYNNPLLSFADQVIFTNHSTASIHLDSMYIQIDEMDTTGLGAIVVEVAWISNKPPYEQFVWIIDTASQNIRRLIKWVFYPPTAEPLSFSGTDTTDEIFKLEMGYCFQCESFPKYVCYFKGKLNLCFSNGQVITLRLISYDLRTKVRQGNLGAVLKKGQGKKEYKGGVRCLANGRRVVKDNSGQVRKIQAAVSYLPDRKK